MLWQERAMVPQRSTPRRQFSLFVLGQKLTSARTFWRSAPPPIADMQRPPPWAEVASFFDHFAARKSRPPTRRPARFRQLKYVPLTSPKRTSHPSPSG